MKARTPGIDGGRWKLLDPLVDRVQSLAADERDAWLAELRGESPELAADLTALLSEQEAADCTRFLAQPLVTQAAGLQLGAYTLEELIGHGGMGSVWRARRADGRFEGQAAVKILNLALLSATGQERFRREGSMLARLAHPGIARLFDAGVSPNGQPYLVLEYVEGGRIDVFADARRLSVTARVRLVIDVLTAVGHAHANLVIHRDLKPSNILVTADGAAKLVDFGIAKLLAEEGREAPDALTRDSRVLTPEFAAPEQVRGGTITTATDVYAVGVLLYLLLTGRPPFVLADRSPIEIERILCDSLPPKPSATFEPDARFAADQLAHAAARHTTPARLRRALRGDLDTIVMKALRKEPERRYATAAALQDDLQRFLDGAAVLARPDSVLYRARKFIGRHRRAVAAAAVLAGLLVGATVRERTLRAYAEAETRKAKAVEEYLVSVFDVANPYAASSQRGADVTARELVDRGAARIDASLSDQPDVQAELRSVLARVYGSLGLFDKAEPLLRRALDQVRAQHGARDARVAAVMDRLGEVLVHRSQFTEAEPLLREALAQRRALLGNANAETAESVDSLATVLQEQNDYAAAEPLFREAVDIRRTIHGTDDQRVAISLNNLALLLFLQGHGDQAEPLYREALTIDERRLGHDHPLTAETLQNLAQLMQEGGRYEEAEPLHRRALTIKRKVFGNAHPSVTISLNNLGNLLAQQLGNVAEGEALVREALALDRQMFGEPHLYVAESLRHLGTVLRFKGDFDGAEASYRQALAMGRALFGKEHLRIALNIGAIGAVEYLKGNLAAAIPQLRESRDQLGRLVGEQQRSYAIATVNLARALREDGQAIEAEVLLREACGRLDPAQPAYHDPFTAAQLEWGLALTDLGRVAEATPHIERALAMRRGRYGDASWRTGEAELALGVALAASGQPGLAEPMLREASVKLQSQRQASPRLVARAEAALAQVQR